jgi:hypothetical protein
MVGATGRGTSVHYQLPEADSLADGVDELYRIVGDPVFEDRFDLADVGDRSRGIAVDDDKVRLLPEGDRADPRFAAQINRPVTRRDRDGFDRRESGFHQQFDLSLVRIAGDDAAATGRIGAGNEQTTRLDERPRTVAPAGGVSVDESPMAAMLRPLMTMVCASRAGPPVPSMTRAFVKATSAASSLTKFITAGRSPVLLTLWPPA